MNKFQKRKHKEIKQIMAGDRLGRITYQQARRAWNFKKRFQWCRPCEDCDTSIMCCPGVGKPIAFCPDNT